MPKVANRKTNWAKWRHMPDVKCWEAVALSLDIDPDKVEHSATGWMADAHLFEEGQAFDDRLDILIANKGRPSGLRVTSLNMASPADGQVDLASFAQWACSLELAWEPIPDELREIATRDGAPVLLSKWPWGDYDTKLLGVLAEAVHEWWSTYDQDNSDTAPLQSEVTEWIEDRLTKLEYQNPGTLAGYMATIIRHEKAPVGRRKKSRTD